MKRFFQKLLARFRRKGALYSDLDVAFFMCSKKED